jgi:hypothetical protein
MPRKIVLVDDADDSPSLQRCSPEAWDQWPWLQRPADNHGRFKYNPEGIYYTHFKLRRNLSPKKIDKYYREYEANGMLVIWEEDGRAYAAYPNWDKHNNLDRRYKSQIPDPPEDLLARAAVLNGNPQETPGDRNESHEIEKNPTLTGSGSGSGSGTKCVSRFPSRFQDCAEFMELADAHPIHKGRREAYEVWVRKKKAGELPEPPVLLAAIKWQREEWERKGKETGFKWLQGWLNKERWNDKPDKPQSREPPRPAKSAEELREKLGLP